jgi:DNA-binding FadR family transcriptional regulator
MSRASPIVERTLETLLKAIREGEYGDTLPPQDVLAENLGISRSPMREAIVILRYCGVLDVRPKTGTRINPESEWDSARLDPPPHARDEREACFAALEAGGYLYGEDAREAIFVGWKLAKRSQ